MANEAKLVYGSATTVVNVTAANSTSGQVQGNTTLLDNSSQHYPYALAVFACAGFASAPAANTVVELYQVRQDVDSTSDCSNGSTVDGTPAAESGFKATGGAELVGVFPLANSASAQRVACNISLKGTEKAYYFTRNGSGQTCNQPITVKITPFSYGPT
jgi:hypothetical protein